MNVSEIIKTDIKFLNFNSFVIEAAQMMQDYNISIIYIKKGNGIVGILTAHDITTRLVSNNGGANTTQVHEIMTSDVLSCDESEDIQNASKIMWQNKVHQLLIRNNQGNILGHITLIDLVHRLTDGSGD